MSSTNLKFDIKDNDTKDIFDNNPFLINISGEVNICSIRCGQEIDNCNSIKINTMTNYGNILSLNTDPNIKCNVKLPYESEGDNKSYVFKNIFVTVPSLHRINNIIYDMEIFIVFSAIQKNGSKLNLVLCTLLSGTDSIPSSGDSLLLPYKLLNELFSGKNTVPEIHGTSSINLIPNPIDISSFIPVSGNRSFYSYTNPKNLNTNIRIFKSSLSVSNNILSILKNKLTPGNSYTNMKNIINTSINPSSGLYFYYSDDYTKNYASFAINKGFEYKKDDNKKQEVEKKATTKKKTTNTNKSSKATTKKKTTNANTNESSKATTTNKTTNANTKKSSKTNKSKKEKFTNKIEDDDIQEDYDNDDDDDIEEDYDNDDDDDIEEDFDDDDDDDDSLDDDIESKKNIEKYDDDSKILDHFSDTDNKNIISVITYLGFVFTSILFLYIIINNCINNPSENIEIDKDDFMEKFKNSSEFLQTVKYKTYFFILFIFCIFLGLMMIIFLLIFFYNPTKYLIRSSSAILFFIFIFIIILFYFLGNYIYYRMETSEKSININYSNYDNYSFKLFEWFSIKEILFNKLNQVSNTKINIPTNQSEESSTKINIPTNQSEVSSKKINIPTNPIPGLVSSSDYDKQQIFKNLGSISSIIKTKPLMATIFILFILFVFIVSCYLFPNYNNITSISVKNFVIISYLTSVVYSFIYMVIYFISSIYIGYFMNDNFFKFYDENTKTKPKIENSKVMMITLFIVVLFILSVIFLSYYFKDMIIISKVFFIFLSISLCVFILFIGYLFFNKESSEVVKSGNNIKTNNTSNQGVEEDAHIGV